MKRNTLIKWILALFLIGLIPQTSMAYSVLTHEALIDVNWDKILLPLLKKKFPGSTADQLKEAHAYAYGGAVAPDMGYYPFGSKLFTNLVHYVRSGDFVNALLADAQTLDEYAFALGCLCHYNADNYGHSLGVNRSVPLVYTKDKKLGDVVTYAEDKTSHIRVEFSFDVLQTARGNYASNSYHDFIGFQVSKELLEKAFKETYGLNVDDLFGNFNRSVSTFRFAVKDFFPEITRVAWVTQKKKIKDVSPTATSRRFVYHMHKSNYNKDFGKDYKRPGFFAHLIAVFIRILPKVGPLKALKFKEPTPEAEKYFVRSFDTTAAHYAIFLNDLSEDKPFHLDDTDFDTGKKTAPGEYTLADDTYSDWLLRLKEKKFDLITPSIKNKIILFYSDTTVAINTKKNQEKWNKTMDALSDLRTVQPSDVQGTK